jgi:hypothetical protein
MNLETLITQASERHRARREAEEAEHKKHIMELRKSYHAQFMYHLKSDLGDEFAALCAIGLEDDQITPFATLVYKGFDVLLYHHLEGGNNRAWDVIVCDEDNNRVTDTVRGTLDELQAMGDRVLLAIDYLTGPGFIPF